MAYLWLKAAHLTALMIWIGGMLAVALVAAIVALVFVKPFA